MSPGNNPDFQKKETRRGKEEKCSHETSFAYCSQKLIRNKVITNYKNTTLVQEKERIVILL